MKCLFNFQFILQRKSREVLHSSKIKQKQLFKQSKKNETFVCNPLGIGNKGKNRLTNKTNKKENIEMQISFFFVHLFLRFKKKHFQYFRND